MHTTTKNGQSAVKDDKPTDTKKGAENTGVLVRTIQPDPMAARLAKIHEVHTLSQRRSTLIGTEDDLRHFETELGETDRIILKNHGGSTIEVKRPEAVKKVLELLKAEISQAISNVNTDLLAAAL